MSVPYIIDSDEADVDADSPLHAGVTKDLWRGNLERTLDQSFYSIQIYPHDGATISHTAASTSFEDFTEFNGIWLPMRRQPDGETWRQIKVTLDAKSTSTSDTYIQFYLLPHYMLGLTPDPVDGLEGRVAYGTITVNSTSYSLVSATIAEPPDSEVGSFGDSDTWAAGVPTTPVDRVSLQAIIGSKTAGTAVKIRSLRIQEVVS